MSVLNWVKKNPTLVYAVAASLVPLVASFGLHFDQERVLGIVSAALTLVAGGFVRRSSLKATAEALKRVPAGYLKLSDLFPQAEYGTPNNYLSEDAEETK
ncbi:hypothetical protein OV320_7870 [Actinobacteria bacterium OV320]|jgi:hypothetical protein|nr:hypothetical protein OV320_7870 [Actinobacteria bacterium OV320]